MPSDREQWRQRIAENPDRFDWLGSARRIVERSQRELPELGPDEEFVMRSDGAVVPRKREYFPPPSIPVPKPGKRSTDLFHNGSSGRVKCASERRCRMCQRTVGELPHDDVVRQITRHHLVPLRWFMREGQAFRAIRNSNANIIPLCRKCHDDIEDGKDKAARRQARRMLRQVLTQKEIAFAVKLRGINWLNATYPLR